MRQISRSFVSNKIGQGRDPRNGHVDQPLEPGTPPLALAPKFESIVLAPIVSRTTPGRGGRALLSQEKREKPADEVPRRLRALWGYDPLDDAGQGFRCRAEHNMEENLDLRSKGTWARRVFLTGKKLHLFGLSRHDTRIPTQERVLQPARSRSNSESEGPTPFSELDPRQGKQARYSQMRELVPRDQTLRAKRKKVGLYVGIPSFGTGRELTPEERQEFRRSNHYKMKDPDAWVDEVIEIEKKKSATRGITIVCKLSGMKREQKVEHYDLWHLKNGPRCAKEYLEELASSESKDEYDLYRSLKARKYSDFFDAIMGISQ